MEKISTFTIILFANSTLAVASDGISVDARHLTESAKLAIIFAVRLPILK